MAAVAAQSQSLTISRSESEAIVTVLSVTITVTLFCAIATEIPTGRLVSTERRRGPAYDLPVAKPVAKDEVVQVAVPVYDHYAFRRLEVSALEQPAQLETAALTKAASAAV